MWGKTRSSISRNPVSAAVMSRRSAIFSVSLIAAAAVGAWWFIPNTTAPTEVTTELPVPPFPPRITEGSSYEACLSTLATDPASALAEAEASQTRGGGEGASHCQGLALIAVGKPVAGAEVLEVLAQNSRAPSLVRALILGQAAQARMMVAQADIAAQDASKALALSPDDTEMLIMRATAEGELEQFKQAVDDLTQALRLDANRSDALVARAVMRRKLNELDRAQADVSMALKLVPDDQDALLERGILRQRNGDAAGARADWEHVRDLDPNSTAAELAEQNLSLLEAGPTRQ